MMSKPPVQSRPMSGEAVPTRTRPERPGLISTLLTGTALVGMTGALLAPVGMAETYPASSTPSSAAVRTVAQITPLDSSRPLAGRVTEAIAKAAAAEPGGPQAPQTCQSAPGGQVACLFSAAQQSSAASTSGDTTPSASPQSGDPLGQFWDKYISPLLKFFTAGAGAVGDTAKAVSSVADVVNPVASAGTAVGSIIQKVMPH